MLAMKKEKLLQWLKEIIHEAFSLKIEKGRVCLKIKNKELIVLSLCRI